MLFGVLSEVIDECLKNFVAVWVMIAIKPTEVVPSAVDEFGHWLSLCFLNQMIQYGYDAQQPTLPILAELLLCFRVVDLAPNGAIQAVFCDHQ